METTSTIALTQDEINALTKLILYIKFYKDRLDMFSQELPDIYKSFILKKIKMSESNSQEKELNNSIFNDYAYPYKW